ncbi:MAG TPA: heparinase II/III family protein [Opitutaceae bacterium]|nr:heparinase II/III family protein [Opitutaceae bacterium]
MPESIIARIRSAKTGYRRPRSAPRLALALALCGLASACLAGETEVATIAAGTAVKMVAPLSGDNGTELEFGPVRSGYRYTVETSTNLAAGTWTALPADALTANGDTWTCVAPAGDVSRRFYRINLSEQSPETLHIRTKQPRLFWNPQIAANVIRAEKAADRDRFLAFVRRQRMGIPDGTDPAAPLDPAAIRKAMRDRVEARPNGEFAFDAMSYGLSAHLARITGSPYAAHHKAYTVAFLEALLEKQFEFFTGDLGSRDKLFALGVIYDWLGAELPADLRRQVHSQAVQLLDDLEREYHFFTRPYFSGGHSRYADVVALAALLAIRNGIETEDAALRQRYFTWLDLIVGHWRSGYNPAQAWMGRDGGYGMGWAYGFAYTSLEPYVMWDNATTEERWTGDWLQERAAFLLYGARNSATIEECAAGAYDPFPYSGNVWSTGFDIADHGFHLLLDDPDGTSAWLYDQLASQYRYNYWPDILHRRPNVAAVPSTGLPLARRFGPSGYVLMRDSWNLDENTLLEFKSTSYLHGNHHHLDQNAFTIFFRGPLAIDSGGYHVFGDEKGGYDSYHAVNYYYRSIAHNTVLVYNPDEKFTYGGNTCSNDGGQQFAIWPQSSYPTLAQMQPGGTNALDGIRAFENHSDFAYALGDATKAYSPAKLSDFRRSIVYLRNFAGTHPVVAIHDRVIATNPAFAKTYLLHSINEPQLSGRRATIVIDDGTSAKRPAALVQETILPADATITAVGGPGKEFWVADNGSGTGQGHNYVEGLRTAEEYDKARLEAGNWRVEVKPGAPRAADSFLHVLTVAESASAAPAMATRLPSPPNADAVIVQSPGAATPGTCLLFHHGGASLDITLNLPSTPDIARLIAVGLPADTAVSLTRTGTTFRLRTNASGTLRTSAQGVLVVDAP